MRQRLCWKQKERSRRSKAALRKETQRLGSRTNPLKREARDAGAGLKLAVVFRAVIAALLLLSLERAGLIDSGSQRAAGSGF